MELNLLLTIVLFLVLALGAGALLLGRSLVRLRRANSSLRDDLLLLREEVRHGHAGVPKEKPPVWRESPRGGDFAARLDHVDLKRRLEGNERGGSVPEKYRLMAAMARRGPVGRDVAEVLKISPAESEQLMRLAGLQGPPASDRTEAPEKREEKPSGKGRGPGTRAPSASGGKGEKGGNRRRLSAPKILPRVHPEARMDTGEKIPKGSGSGSR